MDLVASHRLRGGDLPPFAAGEDLDRFQHGLDVEQTQARGLTGGTLEPERIRDAATQHLKAAAQPQDPATAPDMRMNVHVPSLAPQRREIAERALAPGQQHE